MLLKTLILAALFAHPHYRVREAATAALARFGVYALPALTAGQRSSSLEVQQRCKLLAGKLTDRLLDLGRRDAEERAGSFWGEWYRGYHKEPMLCGAAWRMDGLCWVGMSHGRTKAPRDLSSWTNTQQATDGWYYDMLSWFGRGETWDAAFADASSRGYPDCRPFLAAKR